MSKNNAQFALRCPIEPMGYEENGNFRFRFDTRYLGGDYTIISLHPEFASEKTARAKLFDLLELWDR